MQNDLSNENNQYDKIVADITISKKLRLNHLMKSKRISNLDDSDNATVSTHKNSADSLKSLNSNSEKKFQFSPRTEAQILKQNLTNIFGEETKKRRDNFGREIKKGGKHKIAFADDLDIIKSLTPETPRENNIRKRLRSYSLEKNMKNIFSGIKEIKRSNSLTNDKSKMMKNIYNISKVKINSKKKFKKSFVHIIKVEKFKTENKLNNFSIKRNDLAEEENVSCSCYCSIW